MLEQMVRRVPIVRSGRVVGIVTASDIIQLFVDLHEPPRSHRRVPAS
jgi:signal-transduction protein with cAMP-binding, CBS, and nucleotidyltransferase domain